ncbi:YidH family protein [Thermocrinis sp.]
MLLRKDLPSAKDARIYLSVERTFLGYLRLSLYSLSLAVFLDKMRILSQLTQKSHFQAQITLFIFLLSALSLLVIFASFVIFYMDVRYLEGGVEVSPKETTDPRIYMASERTFLAWVRTAIGLIVFGFVIEKFEFFLLQLERFFNIHFPAEHKDLVGIGVLVILMGIFTLILGMINFNSTVKRVDRGYYRTNVKLYLAYGGILFLVCLVLTAYMLKVL